MKQRGRPRQGATAPVVIAGTFGQRPDPPAMLTKRQRAIWLEAVASEPVDFFATGALRNLLAEYCGHRETWETLSELINAAGEDWSNNTKAMLRYQNLLKMRELESRAAGNLAMKLRLTNQSRYSSTTAGTASRNTLKGRKPWEDD